MKTIETTAIIGEDHMLSIQLPNTIPPGEANVVVIIEEKTQEKQESSSSQPKWGKVGKKKPPFPRFSPIPLKGEGLTASEMLIQDRNERQQKISGS